MKIVGVHGIGNFRQGETAEQAAAHLSALWAKRLAEGSDVSVVYYADLLRDPLRQSGDDELEDLTDEEGELLAQLLESFPASERAAQGWIFSLVRAHIAEVAESRLLRPRMVEWLMTRFVKEAAAYLREGTAVRERLAATLRKVQPDVLIAHSLGTVVAYETLHAEPALKVPLWVTLGSPLAAPKAIFERLTPPPVAGRGERPPGVARWANLADPGDLFAIPRKGISQRFAGVDSDDHDVVHAFDFHKVVNYLQTARLRALLAQ
ncbi:hypothetical protein GCM10009555_091500 [Acrocarpospora macrocephala]|uniref:Serine peptidase n=1 Tax=Acrocarpospora macrocephala TaxID=150177 RepID=A0A5M3WKJ7_9ACTN|nr:serine peptidase [Acrocarpospora macrocephala]GES09126.1 hypothetical protein Amac_027220 [Acrocarpospora macrocephala]